MTRNLRINLSIFCLALMLLGGLIAIFSQTSHGVYLEEELGLNALFNLRGSIPAPRNVVIVSIDQVSAEVLRLGDNPENWPRHYYTQLIAKLNKQSPALIAFNIHFSESRNDNGDTVLAEAMAASKKIILSNYLKQYTPNGFPSNSEFSYERVINPIPIFQDAALSSSPFPLAKTSSTIKTFWTFKRSAGDIPTFPVTVFQYFLFKQHFLDIKHLLQQLDPSISKSLPESFPALQQAGQTDQLQSCDQIIAAVTHAIIQTPETLAKFRHLLTQSSLTPESQVILESWLDLLQGSENLYLNHYGRAGSIFTIPFYQVLVADYLQPELFKNSIVMVGYSDRLQPEKNQDFFTAYSSSNQDSVSPIEIAATAVANLLQRAWIMPMEAQQQIALLATWGAVLAAVISFLSYPIILLSLFLMALGFVGTAEYVFYQHTLWIPVFFPIAVQIPLALTLATIVHFVKNRQAHRHMQKAFSYYIPRDVIHNLTQHPRIEDLHSYGELLQGVCMATDAGEYTALGENLNPLELNQLMNKYYAILFPLVKLHQGIVSDVMGDAMLAIWASAKEDQRLRIKACKTALAIKAAIDDFNQTQPFQLHTRIGLHYGEMRLGNVGAQDHFEYRAVGDVVNTATRVEGLNKLLGTKILISQYVIQDIELFNIREMGTFIFKGKTQAVKLYELLHSREQNTSNIAYLTVKFTAALKCFQHYRWQEALSKFQSLQQEFPQDGPTLFYIKYLTTNMCNLPAVGARHSEAVIDVGNQFNPVLYS